MRMHLLTRLYSMEHCVISIPAANITTYENFTFLSYIPQCTPENKGTTAPPEDCAKYVNECEFVVQSLYFIVDTFFNVSWNG